jgi:lipopolysaccharide/colanic/teichoic acid biosynthesis glycosyltransferase
MPEMHAMPAVGGLTRRQQRLKRLTDVVVAGLALTISAPVAAVCVVAARRDTGEPGIFAQERIGRDGQPFRAYKIRTMRSAAGTSVTTSGDPRITRLGRILRMTKLDEVPQLVNVLKGDMSIVGPRPDVAGWADALTGEDRQILTVRPGITGPASLAYRHEERLLGSVDDPETYNREVIWPDKVMINRAYVARWSWWRDLGYMAQTAASIIRRVR